MTDALRSLYVVIELKDKLTSQLDNINKTVDQTKSKISKLTEFVEQHKAAIAGLGAGLSALGYGGFRVLGGSARDFERAILEMQARTGATNEEIKKMTETVKQLARANSDAFTTISEVVTIVRSRFGDLGDETKTVAQAILDFAKITGTDAVTAANSLSVVMKSFNIPATKMYEVTDTLITAQQRFGVQSAYIIELLKNNAAPLKMLNLSFSEAVGLLSALEANGVNVSRALMGLRSAAAKGIDVKQALRELAQIRDSTERTRRATEIFGSYAGPGLARVLEGGTEALDKFMLKIEDIRGTTKEASATIDKSLSEQIGILKNNITILAVEIGKTLLPIMKGAVKIIKTMADTFEKLPAPIKSFIGIIAGLVTVFSAVMGPLLMQIAAFTWLYSTIANMGGLTGVLASLKAAMLGFAGSVWTALAPLLPFIGVIGAVITAVLLLQDVLVKGWEKSYLGRFVSWLLKKLPFLKPVAEGVGNAVNQLRQGFDWLAKSIGGAISWIQQALDKLGPLKYLLLGPVGGIIYLITHIDKLKQSITSVPDAIGRFLDRMGPLKYILLGPVGSIILLIRNIDRLRSATSSALTAIKSLWDRTIGWIITKIDEFITKIKQAWEFITKSPIGKIAGLITGGVRTVVEYLTMKTTEEKTIHLVETKKKEELLRRNVTEEEIRKKAIEQYEYVKSLKIQGITNEDEIKRGLEAEFGEIIVNPQIIPYVGKPKYDRKFYEEGSIKLKIQKPVFKPEIEKPALPKLSVPELTIKPKVEKPELSWLEQLYLRVKPLFEATKLPELTGVVRYVPDVIKPEMKNLVAGITYIPKLVKPEITHELTRITPTPSQLINSTQTVIHQPANYQIKHEHKTINVPKIEIKIEGVKDPDKVAELVERKLNAKFNAIGIY